MAATARILIVDDEPKMAAFLSLTFEHAGYTVRTAASGGDAIALFSEERFDVMLSDVMMPGMNGYQLVEWVAAHHPTIRTALMSGHDEVRRKCSYSLQCPLIAKPFSPTEILSFVGQVLAES